MPAKGFPPAATVEHAVRALCNSGMPDLTNEALACAGRPAATPLRRRPFDL